MTILYDDKPALSPRWMKLIEGYEVCAPDYTQSLADDETAAAILAGALKENAYEVEKALGGQETLVAECRRFRRWLVRDGLPASFWLYRGGVYRNIAEEGICWTTDILKADYFAQYRMDFPDAKANPEASPITVKRLATRDEVLMALTDDIEDEIILIRKPVNNREYQRTSPPLK
jgi:hypothetical protein